jgi:Holliday junction DNA helicase RuvA
MIALISGTLVYKSPTYLIVEASGVGYRVFVPLTTFYEIPETGEPVTLHIHTSVKQDAIHLFGFLNPADRDIFQLLLAVNGIGPKLALNILSGIAAEELVKALSEGNLKRLVSIPGVGKKMAERIILELKDKALKFVAGVKVSGANPDLPDADLREDALSALINLGYKSQAASDAIEKAAGSISPHMTLDLLLKNALRVLSG